MEFLLEIEVPSLINLEFLISSVSLVSSPAFTRSRWLACLHIEGKLSFLFCQCMQQDIELLVLPHFVLLWHHLPALRTITGC